MGHWHDWRKEWCCHLPDSDMALATVSLSAWAQGGLDVRVLGLTAKAGFTHGTRIVW